MTSVSVSPTDITSVDLESIPGQIGTGILRLSDGFVVSPCTGKLTDKDADIVYRILLEVGTVLPSNKAAATTKRHESDGEYGNEGLRRITVAFQSARYAATVCDDGCVYIIMSRSS
mmetsp:Transcript_35166/g.51649  ORF Transcript_35166/g.51649 Transcript_35166/m.51649 type:complete len:116 (+) Transcript_35166:60-407(+)